MSAIPTRLNETKMQSLQTLRTLLEEVPGRLKNLPPTKIEGKSAPLKWSAKEELGHLIDSAANNHQRIVRTQLELEPAMPNYEGDEWVELHRYQERDWDELIETWRVLNRQLLAAAEAADPSAWSRTCTIADSQPLTLKFVFEDYLEHMKHHLKHIGIKID